MTEAHVAAIRDAVGTPASRMTEEIGRKYLDEVDPGGLIPFFGALRFDDYLLVRERNELDVERVALYWIERE